MHSTRMHTAHLLPVSPSMHCSQGVYLPWGTCPGGVPARGVPAQEGCTCQRGVTAWGVPAQGVYLPKGVYLPGEVPARRVCPGGYLPGGVYLPGGCTCTGVYLPRYYPTVNRMTDRCKILPCPRLHLRPVIKHKIINVSPGLSSNITPSNSSTGCFGNGPGQIQLADEHKVEGQQGHFRLPTSGMRPGVCIIEFQVSLNFNSTF